MYKYYFYSHSNSNSVQKIAYILHIYYLYIYIKEWGWSRPVCDACAGPHGGSHSIGVPEGEGECLIPKDLKKQPRNWTLKFGGIFDMIWRYMFVEWMLMLQPSPWRTSLLFRWIQWSAGTAQTRRPGNLWSLECWWGRVRNFKMWSNKVSRYWIFFNASNLIFEGRCMFS